eukprot:335193-Rhodomonas_salina.2
MSGTDLAYGAICLRAPYAVSGTDIRTIAAVRCPPMRYPGTDIAYGVVPPGSRQTEFEEPTVIVTLPEGTTPTRLRACYAMSGTHRLSLQVLEPTALRARYAMSGTDIAYGAICQCACYAMSGTIYDIYLCACYAMSGTDLAHTVRQIVHVFLNTVMLETAERSVLSAYARATRSPIAYGAASVEVRLQHWSAALYLPTRVLRDVRYSPSVWDYATSGTDIAYVALRCPRMELPGVALHIPTGWCHVTTVRYHTGIAYDVRLCYAMSGTDIAYAIRTCYAMSDNGVGYALCIT